MRRALLGALAAALLLGACSDAGVPRPDDAACPIGDGEAAGRAVLRCTDGTVAYVETSAGSGTGVVVELDGRPHLVTNAHVVDPFAAADVVLGDDELESVPVVGVDAAADIAVLGPIDRTLPALRLGSSESLERGDEVFLVGFPGGESDTEDIETTIASGIISRRRRVEEFGQTYLQTDASISGGQSGGPLFDRTGRLVGISGLSYADEFALVLSAEDVSEAVERILDGDGDDYVAVPPTLDDGGGELEGSLRLAEATDGQALFLPADDADRTWNFELDPRAQVTVAITDALEYELLAESANARELELQAERDAFPEMAEDPELEGVVLGEDELEPEVRAREVGPRRFRIPVEAGHAAEIWVRGPLLDAPLDVSWRSDQPVAQLSRPVREVRLGVGDEEDFVINAYDTAVDVLLDLDAGDRVLLHARSPQGDPSLTVLGPDLRLDHVTAYDPEAAGAVVIDDSGGGLYGTDARATFEAEQDGTHRIRVSSYEGTLSLIRLSITPCGGIVDCDEEG